MSRQVRRDDDCFVASKRMPAIWTAGAPAGPRGPRKVGARGSAAHAARSAAVPSCKVSRKAGEDAAGPYCGSAPPLAFRPPLPL